MGTPFVTISRGGPDQDIEDGVYVVTLIEISDPRTVTAQRGPKAGQDVDLIDWTFALNDLPPATIEASTSTASGPKSKMYAFLTALFGGTPPPVGTQLEKEHLIGREALATVNHDDGGWPRIANLGAIPKTAPMFNAQASAPAPQPAQAAPVAHQPVVPTDTTAMVPQPVQRAPRRAQPAGNAPVVNAQGYQGTAAEVAARAAAEADDSLPF